MHRQTYHLLRHCVTHRQPYGNIDHSRLLVQRNRVVHGSGNTSLLTFRLQGCPVIYADGVLGINTGVVRFDIRDAGNTSLVQQPIIGLCDLLTQLDFFFKYFKLWQQNRRLQSIQPAVHPHSNVVIAAILAVPGNLTHDLCQFIIIGEDRTTIAIAAQRLAGEETRAGNGCQVARALALVGGTETLRGILNHWNAVFSCNSVDSVHSGALAIQRNRNNRLGTRCDGRFQQLLVEVIGARINVHIHRLGTEQGHGFSGGDVGESRRDDFIAGTYPQSHLRNLQRIGAVGAGDAVLGADEGSQLFFQFGDFRAEDILAMGEDTLDTGVDLVPDAGLLGLQVDEFNHLLHVHFAQGVAVQYIACIGVLAGNFTLACHWQCQLLAELAHPANLACGYTHHQGICWYVLVDYRTGTDESELTNGHTANDGAIGPEGSAFLYQGVTVLVLALDQ